LDRGTAEREKTSKIRIGEDWGDAAFERQPTRGGCNTEGGKPIPTWLTAFSPGGKRGKKTNYAPANSSSTGHEAAEQGCLAPNALFPNPRGALPSRRHNLIGQTPTCYTDTGKMIRVKNYSRKRSRGGVEMGGKTGERGSAHWGSSEDEALKVEEESRRN